MKNREFYLKVMIDIIAGIIKGTLIIAAVATDGVVIAADSRAGIADANGKVIAYIDSMPKILLLNGKYPIAFAGSSQIEKKFIANIIEEYNSMRSVRGIVETCIDFRKYLLSISNSFPQIFIGGGYPENAPWIFSFNNSKMDESDGFLFNEPELTPYLRKYNELNLTCQQLVPILEEVIYAYAKDAKKEHLIGGPIAIIEIKKGNNANWIQNDFSRNVFKNYNELVSRIKEGKIKVTMLAGYQLADVIKIMETSSFYDR